MSKAMTQEKKAAIIAAVLDSLSKSTVGSQAISGLNVGDEINLIDVITSSTNPRVNITKDNPQYVFESANRRRFTVSGNGIPAMRVLTEGADASVVANATTLEDIRSIPQVEFFKQAVESLEPGKEIDLTAIKLKVVAKVANPDASDPSKLAMLNSCYKRYDDYRDAVRGTDPDYTAARINLHSGGLKPEFASKNYANPDDRKFFQTTPVFQITWN